MRKLRLVSIRLKGRTRRRSIRMLTLHAAMRGSYIRALLEWDRRLIKRLEMARVGRGLTGHVGRGKDMRRPLLVLELRRDGRVGTGSLLVSRVLRVPISWMNAEGRWLLTWHWRVHVWRIGGTWIWCIGLGIKWWMYTHWWINCWIGIIQRRSTGLYIE